jgi:hypothetical protein
LKFSVLLREEWLRARFVRCPSPTTAAQQDRN